MGWFSKDKCAKCAKDIWDESDLREIAEDDPSDLPKAMAFAEARCGKCRERFHRSCANVRVERGWLLGDIAVMTCPKCRKETNL